MRKLLLLLPVLLVFACGPHHGGSVIVKADRGNFTVTSITALVCDCDTVRGELVSYTLLSDTMLDDQGIQNEQQAHDPFKIIFTDTSGKYAVGDTLTLVLKQTTQ